MKKATKTFTFLSRPITETIVKTHAIDCEYLVACASGETDYLKLRRLLTTKCECPKHLYVKQIRYREALGVTKWEDAETKRVEWTDRNDPDLIEKRLEKERTATTRIEIPEAFRLFLQSKDKGDPSDPSLEKFRAIQNDFTRFIDERNSGKSEVERVLYVDQITESLLEDEWRPTWFGGKGTYWSRTKRREQVRSIFKYFVQRRWSSHNVAYGLQLLQKNKKTLKPTPPFSATQYAAILEGTAIYEASFDTPRKLHYETSDRLAALIEVMRWSGCRISDACVMRRDAIRDGIWYFTAMKNHVDVAVPLPEWVIERLNSLPLDPQLDDCYYFWSGAGSERRATKPWMRALARLFPLCDQIVYEVTDVRNKKKVRPSSHMFRNTLAVEMRKAGFSYAEIAEMLGDDEQTVKDHYKAYCEDIDKELHDRLRAVHQTGRKAMETARPQAPKRKKA